MRRWGLRLLAVTGLVVTAGAAYALITEEPEKPFFDPNINHQASLKAAKKFKRGTPRARVEKKLGVGGRKGEDMRFEEPDGAACRYYTHSGGSGYVQVCYVGDRLIRARRQDDLNAATGD